MLFVSGMTKRFGGVTAVDNVSFEVAANTVHSVIGPNGAGKTTLFNLITGLYIPSAGEVKLNGEIITGMPPEALAALGVSRTFQNLRVCMNMSALDNVMIGAHLRLPSSMFAALLRLPHVVRADQACREEARELMRFVGIEKFAGLEASQLPYGVLKRLEIARALIAQPKLLMLDEPAAGLNISEKAEIGTLIRKVADSGVTVVLVEHDMKMVMRLSDRVVVLDNGRKLAEGTPKEVTCNPLVVAAYLGADHVPDLQTETLESEI